MVSCAWYKTKPKKKEPPLVNFIHGQDASRRSSLLRRGGARHPEEYSPSVSGLKRSSRWKMSRWVVLCFVQAKGLTVVSFFVSLWIPRCIPTRMSQLQLQIQLQPLVQELQFWLDKAVAWGQADGRDARRDTCLHLSGLKDFIPQLVTHINDVVSYHELFSSEIYAPGGFAPVPNFPDAFLSLITWSVFTERPVLQFDKLHLMK